MAKENVRKMKRQPTIWENIFAKDTSDKCWISKICKERMTQYQEDKHPIKKWAKIDTSPRRTYRGPRDI